MSKSTKTTLSRQATDRDPLLHAAHPTSTSTPTSIAITSTSTGTKTGYQTDDVALDMSNARLSSLKEAAQSKPLKRTKKSSIGGAGFLWLLIRVVLHLTLLGVHGYMVYVAQHYADEECERRLDQWAWLQGVGILSLSTIYVARAFIEERINESWDTFCFRFSWCFNIIATITALVWTILGSVWTFSIDPSTLVCPRHLYDICWYYLVSVWGILASCVAIMLCLACIFCIKLRK